MKHEAETDLRSADSTLSLLVELTGPDRRVLDLGCGDGELGLALQARGSRVVGVESDPVAAQAAGAALDEVVVGNLDELDLVDRFGKESFDVVVLHDVLQHVVDPVALLGRARSLLTESGSIVASLPNAAHGSVRLALLGGDHGDRPLGLLDPPPRRLFSRASIHEVLRQAGLVPVDVRRTTAGVFETGLPLCREDFEQGVVDAVEGDPESITHRFVFRARPEESVEALAEGIPAPRSRTAVAARLGVWSAWEPDDLRAALVVRVTVSELARRLPGAVVRPFSAGAEPAPSTHDGGLAVETLGPWSAERASRLARDLDCVVVAGRLPPSTVGRQGCDPARYLLGGIGDDLDCPVVWSAVDHPDPIPTTGSGAGPPAYRTVLDTSPASGPGGAATVVPDPLLLLPRLLDRPALARRLELARGMGWYPAVGRAVAVEVDGAMLGSAEAVARGLDAAASGTDAVVVLVPLDHHDPAGRRAAETVAAAMRRPALVVGDDAVVDDVVAVMGCAAALVARSPTALAVGLAYDVPVALLAGGATAPGPMLGAVAGAGSPVAGPEDLAGLLDDGRFAPDAPGVAGLQAELDAHFDRVASIADEAARARPRAGAPPRLPPAEYVAALELSHRRMRERLGAERAAVAGHLEELRRRSQLETAYLRVQRDQLETSLRQALADATRQRESEKRTRDELVRAVAGLEALEGTRFLRLIRPARALYARLRGTRL